jgi:hypothetical protein
MAGECAVLKSWCASALRAVADNPAAATKPPIATLRRVLTRSDARDTSRRKSFATPTSKKPTGSVGLYRAVYWMCKRQTSSTARTNHRLSRESPEAANGTLNTASSKPNRPANRSVPPSGETLGSHSSPLV